MAVGRLRGYARLTIDHPVDLGVSQDDLYVFAGFGERNGFDDFRNLFIIALGLPGCDAILAGIVRSGCVLRRARLVVEERAGRERLYELQPRPLQQVAGWIEGYRSFWLTSLGNLKRYLEEQ